MNTQKKALETIVPRASGYIEQAVNRGLMIAMLKGVAEGARAMCRGGVPLHVCKRVLVNSTHRRMSDWR